MKTDNQVDTNLQNLPQLVDMAENNHRNDGEINADLPLEALVISHSGMCSFMGARSPWPTT